MPTVAISPNIIGRLQPGAGNQSAIPSSEVSSTRTTGQRLNGLERSSQRVRHRQLVCTRRRTGAGSRSQQATRASTTTRSAPSNHTICATRLCALRDKIPRISPQPISTPPAIPTGTARTRSRKAPPRLQAWPMTIR